MRRALLATVVIFALGGAGALAWALTHSSDLEPRLAEQLQQRGRTVWLRAAAPQEAITGTTWVAEQDVEPLRAALESDDPKLLADAMESEDIDALVVAAGPREVPEDAPVRQQLEAYAPIQGMRGVYLSPAHAIYQRAVAAQLGDAARVMPRIARAIIGGQSPPRISRFPEPLRQIQNVEVMVLLRDRGRPRLWRSARGSSVARALITASAVARQRWTERSSALGGPLDVRLPFMDVEVSLLEEDGTLGSTAPSFIERVFFDGHGVAYERPGAWRYQLPDATRESGQGSAVRAYQDLFEDNALPDDSFGRPDLRFYRLVTTELGVSPAPALGGEFDDDSDSLFDALEDSGL